ncbi:MAG TPA: carboxypeptidase-like regulatory domain-containing protein [Terriglobia bacterium]|nr:carboxypeptidase-like regulatory domain-containing protein [Terriglobia bacterium]
MIKRLNSRIAGGKLMGAAVLAAFCLIPKLAQAADYGRVLGSVLDTQGNPLVGATVLIIGPVIDTANSLEPGLDRILTDAHGKFLAEHLVPGWYSLRVTSPTRLPAQRNRIHVEAGQTAQEKFVLSDIFAPIHIQLPPANLTTWGDDWKWVLRTSASTRPVMRFVDDDQQTTADNFKPPLPASQHLIGMTPGSTRRDALEDDQGMGSILAYLRPLSEDTDLLVAGEMSADGSLASSLATALRKNIFKGNPEEISLAVHQLNFGVGVPMIMGGDSHGGQYQAQALAASYSHTQRISDAVTVSTGVELDYLNAASDAMTANPHVQLEYQESSANTFAFRYGISPDENGSTLLERVGDLNAFPRVTLRGNRTELEKLNHAEVSFDRKLGKTSRAEFAAYHDNNENAAVWGIGGPLALASLAGSFLPNAHVDGVTLNAGQYQSSGVRAAYVREFGKRLEVAVVYTSGDALVVRSSQPLPATANEKLRDALSVKSSQSVAGKVTARIPICKTQITTSYQWIQRGRVTGLDPAGQASLQMEPYLGVELRQPLPTLAFLPAHIEALADFRNLLAQGYTPVSQGGQQLILTPAYRSFRGGFSVQF